MKSEEIIWVEQIVSGAADAEKAFQALSVKYGPKMYTQIFRVVQNEAIAKDVIQNVFIKYGRTYRVTRENQAYILGCTELPITKH